jgi:hypothetical protein
LRRSGGEKSFDALENCLRLVGMPKDRPFFAQAAAEYHQARGNRVLIVETPPERIARLRQLLRDDVSFKAAFNALNDPRKSSWTRLCGRSMTRRPCVQNLMAPSEIEPLRLTFFEDLSEPPPKRWLIKNVIAHGETSSWIGLAAPRGASRNDRAGHERLELQS